MAVISPRMRMNSGSEFIAAPVARTRQVTRNSGPSVARGPAVSGMMRSASSIASSTSLVTSTTVFFSRARSPRSRPAACARVSASSARQRLIEQQDFGIRSPARAPPPRAGACRRTVPRVADRWHATGPPCSMYFCGCARALRPWLLREHGIDGERDVAEDGEPRHQRIALEHHAAVRVRRPAMRLPRRSNSPASGAIRPGDGARSAWSCREPEKPTMATNSPSSMERFTSRRTSVRAAPRRSDLQTVMSRKPWCALSPRWPK